MRAVGRDSGRLLILLLRVSNAVRAAEGEGGRGRKGKKSVRRVSVCTSLVSLSMEGERGEEETATHLMLNRQSDSGRQGESKILHFRLAPRDLERNRRVVEEWALEETRDMSARGE